MEQDQKFKSLLDDFGNNGTIDHIAKIEHRAIKRCLDVVCTMNRYSKKDLLNAFRQYENYVWYFEDTVPPLRFDDVLLGPTYKK